MGLRLKWSYFDFFIKNLLLKKKFFFLKNFFQELKNGQDFVVQKSISQCTFRFFLLLEEKIINLFLRNDTIMVTKVYVGNYLIKIKIILLHSCR